MQICIQTSNSSLGRSPPSLIPLFILTNCSISGLFFTLTLCRLVFNMITEKASTQHVSIIQCTHAYVCNKSIEPSYTYSNYSYVVYNTSTQFDMLNDIGFIVNVFLFKLKYMQTGSAGRLLRVSIERSLNNNNNNNNKQTDLLQ